MSRDRDPKRVRGMFGAIARRYDLLNHVLSANMDRSWRRTSARALPEGPLERVLDLCGGTGDLSLELLREREIAKVVCCDFSHPMLLLARRKFASKPYSGRLALLEADGLRLPFPPCSFDAVTVAFGVRNFADMDGGLSEIHRVLRPSGCLVVLEFSRPTAPVLAQLYGFYLRFLLPRLGDGVTGGRGAYGYLARTIASFPDAAALASRIRDAGFAACDWTAPTGGIVAVHTAYKTAAAGDPIRLRREGAASGPSARGAGSPPAGR